LIWNVNSFSRKICNYSLLFPFCRNTRLFLRSRPLPGLPMAGAEQANDAKSRLRGDFPQGGNCSA
jgi:hypothetical protein